MWLFSPHPSEQSLLWSIWCQFQALGFRQWLCALLLRSCVLSEAHTSSQVRVSMTGPVSLTFPFAKGNSLKKGRCIFCSRLEKVLWIFMCQNVTGRCRDYADEKPRKGSSLKLSLPKAKGANQKPQSWMGEGWRGPRGGYERSPESTVMGFQGWFCLAGTNHGKGMIAVILGIKKMDTCRSSPFNGDHIQDVLGS